MHLAGVLCAFLCLLAVLSDGGATLSKKDKKGKKKKEKVGLHDWCMYLISYGCGLGYQLKQPRLAQIALPGPHWQLLRQATALSVDPQPK